jgi:hypothetical protein
MPKTETETVEHKVRAFKASELDCSMWCDEALH